MSIATTAREKISTALARSVFDNPVVTKEFRTRMRGWKAFLVMGAYCLVMSAVLLIAYYSMVEIWEHRNMGPFNTRVSFGRELFVVLAWAQAILLTMIAPALSSGSLTQELERKTIEMVALTPLTAGRLVLGKQLADFTYTLVLLLCSLPLAGITMMLGGISPAEIGITYALLVAWVFLLTSLGTMLSSLSKKTPIASLSSFGVSVFYLICTSAFGGAIVALTYSGYRAAHYDLSPFMLLCPAWVPYGALEFALVCGTKMPLALTAFVLHMALGVLFLLVASTHVQHKPAERALSVRLMMLAVFSYCIWLGRGNQTRFDMDSLMQFGTLYIVLMMIAVIFFSTGVIRKTAGKSMFGYAFSWRKVFRSDVGGAILFMLLWSALCYAWGGLATHLSMKANHAAPQPGYWTAYWRIGISISAIVAGTTAVGVLCSSMVRTRSSAAALLVLFVLAAFAGYAVINSYLDYARVMGNFKPNQALLQLSALWPVTPILAATGSAGPNPPSWVRNAWIVTSAVYLTMGFLSLLLAGKAQAKFGGVQEEQ